jgi:hypothetical protein
MNVPPWMTTWVAMMKSPNPRFSASGMWARAIARAGAERGGGAGDRIRL